MITIRRIDEKNVWDIIKLEVDDNQKTFVATNTESIIEAYTTVTAGGVAIPYGIYQDELPVGFLMIGYEEIPNQDESPIKLGKYSIWRLMIDKKYQGKGYGRAALRLALDFIKTYPVGAADYCYLSYEPENTVAKALYNSFGFKENGEYDGEEAIAIMTL